MSSFGNGALDCTDTSSDADMESMTKGTETLGPEIFIDDDRPGLSRFDAKPRRAAPRTFESIGAFIFDVDGVIADTADLHATAWRRVADEEGLPFAEGLSDELRGLSRKASLEKLLGGRSVPADAFEAMMDRKNRYYAESLHRLEPKDILPGVTCLLDGLRRFDIKLAAASASCNARTVLSCVGVMDEFEVIMDGNDVARSKHGLHQFALAAASLRMVPQRCVVVDDSTAGLSAARQLGMRSIGLGERDRLCAATMTFDSLRGVEARTLLHWLDQSCARKDAVGARR